MSKRPGVSCWRSPSAWRLGGRGRRAHACDGAGVIIRIEGQPQDVQIQRNEGGVDKDGLTAAGARGVCHGDVVRTVGTTYVVLSIDGAGAVRVDHNAAYTVPLRRGRPAWRATPTERIDDQVMPDMKRLPWNVRLKGAGDDFGFALPALMAGGQQLQAGSRPLLVRLVGGTAPYKVEVHDANGALVASQVSASHEVVLACGELRGRQVHDHRQRLHAALARCDIRGGRRDAAAGRTFGAIADPEDPRRGHGLGAGA